MRAEQRDDDERPLDPAVERVRKRLVKFVAINLGILFVALMAVVLALVYKSMTVPDRPSEAAAGAPAHGAIALPAGARIVSQSISGERLSLHLELADESEAFLIWDLAAGRAAATLPVTRE